MRRPLSFAAAVVVALVAVHSAAAQPVQVVDWNPATVDDGSVPFFVSEFVASGGRVYFNATDGIHGNELWATDGTPSGTRLVRDLCPGVCSANPRGLTEFFGRLYFAADDGVHGSELWATDGTSPGTVLVADIVPGLAASNPGFLRALPSSLVFTASDPAHGAELWTTDGSAAGTVRIADIEPGAEGSNPFPMIVDGGRYYFSAEDAAHGRELWATDGTAAGTGLVKDTRPGPNGGLANVQSFGGIARSGVLGGRIFFAADDGVHGFELWATDGTPGGTAMVADLDLEVGGSGVPDDFAVLGSKLLFRASDGLSMHGFELWATDGTAAGTELIADIRPGGDGSGPYELTTFGGRVYFHADDGVHGRELWASDGTAAGTGMVADVQAGASSGLEFFYTLHQLTAVGAHLLFFADDGIAGEELWRTDGTSAGTELIADLNPGPGDGEGGSFGLFIQFPIVFDGRFYFRSSFGPSSSGVFATTASSDGATLVRRMNEQTSSTALFFGRPIFFGGSQANGTTAALGDRLIAQATDGASGIEPIASDGTAAGTVVLRDIAPGTGDSTPREMNALGSRVLFVADDPSAGTTLFATDGTGAGTVALVDLDPSSPNGALSARLLHLGGAALFAASDGSHGVELWRSDGTPGGTGQLADLSPGTASSAPSPLAAVGATAYFSAHRPAEGFELWTTDGTATGTALVADLTPGPDSTTFGPAVGAPDRALGPALFFVAETAATGRELWISDGTAAGTHIVLDLAPGPASAIRAGYPNGFAQPDTPMMALAGPDRLVFVADDGVRGDELWVTDGTAAGTHLLRDLLPGPASSEPRWLTRLGARVLFVADDGSHGRELWATDGTPFGTALIADFWPSTESSLPMDLTSIGGAVLLSADDGVHGRELWIADGTVSGARRLSDIAPGPLPSSPLAITPATEGIYFAATDGTTGFEFYRLPRAGLGAQVRASKLVGGRFVPGGRVTYTIELTNDGPGAAPDNPGFEMTDALPAGLALVGATASAGVVDVLSPGPGVTWSGEIPAGSTVTIVVQADVLPGVASGTVIANQATIAFDSDADGVNESTGVSDDPGAPGAGDATGFTVGLGFYTVPPCRLVDSRESTRLANGETRLVTAAGACGIAATAKAVSYNVTVVNPNNEGFLRLTPSDVPPPLVASSNFRTGQTRTNNGIVGLGADGRLAVTANLPEGGGLDVVIDVNGWFE